MGRNEYYIINPSQYPVRNIKIYILPASPDPEVFSVILPKWSMWEKIPAENWMVTMTGYSSDDFPLEAEVRERVYSAVSDRISSYTSRADTLFTSGIVLTVAGLINWFLPDPLILIDEAVISAAGILLAAGGIKGRKNRSQYRENLTDLEMQLRKIRMHPHPVLTRIYDAVRERHNSGMTEPGTGDLEEETRWMVKLIDFGELIDQGETDNAELEEIAEVISRFVPAEKLTGIKNKFGFSDKRYKKKAEAEAEKRGLSAETLDVYLDFYNGIKKYLSEENRGSSH
ncbi:MAG: hypothetical protein ACLFST_09590 [Spirochaetia bacterium]